MDEQSGTLREYELYDHRADPEETRNLAAQPEDAAVIRALIEALHAGWRAALPPGISD